jgi:Sjoegren syndrome nuclear autoantigen 1
LVRSLEGLKERRENIIIEIKKEEDRKIEIERIISKLREELEGLNESLDKKYDVKNEFDKVIQNTEGAFVKV